jgi:hypothetical protein
MPVRCAFFGNLVGRARQCVARGSWHTAKILVGDVGTGMACTEMLVMILP